MLIVRCYPIGGMVIPRALVYQLPYPSNWNTPMPKINAITARIVMLSRDVLRHIPSRNIMNLAVYCVSIIYLLCNFMKRRVLFKFSLFLSKLKTKAESPPVLILQGTKVCEFVCENSYPSFLAGWDLRGL